MRANLHAAYLIDANLREADLSGAKLSEAKLRRANLSDVSLWGANLRDADLSDADLTGANLTQVTLVNTNLTGATLSGCNIFGISAWNLNLERAIQSDLTITEYGEPVITVDNLEVAQFMYLLLHNAKLRSVIDTLTTKSVLILGRFTEERKAVLDAIKDELRKRNYIPILFDFDGPSFRDTTETVRTLAGLARFIIADLSDPHSIPQELMAIAPALFSVPIVTIFCPTKEHPNPYSMFDHLLRLPQVLPIYPYHTSDELIASLEEKVIKPAEEKVIAVRPSPL